jgi:DNA-3-methyladenine glycosylase I
MAYHDREWGAPAFSDPVQFEFLVLESAQAGLSWRTILNRREAYRKAYRGFDPRTAAGFGPDDAERLLSDPGIIRNRLKIESSIHNARLCLELIEEFGSIAEFFLSFTGGSTVTGKWKTMDEVPARTELSDRISAEMKRRGFKFTGSVIVYSHLQATGIVNDHIQSCFRYAELLGGAERGP